MAKLHLQSIAPLGIIAATLACIIAINVSKPDALSLNTSDEPAHEQRISKPGAQVSLASPQRQSLALFEQKNIVLKLSSPLKSGSLRVSVSADDSLLLGLDKTNWEFELAENQDELLLPISLYANENGLHYVHIFTQYTNEAGQSSARALAAEFKVGEGDVESAKHFAKSSLITINQTQGIISLPSKESIF